MMKLTIGQLYYFNDRFLMTETCGFSTSTRNERHYTSILAKNTQDEGCRIS